MRHVTAVMLLAAFATPLAAAPTTTDAAIAAFEAQTAHAKWAFISTMVRTKPDRATFTPGPPSSTLRR